MIFKTCPLCGANLDPGETCDCRETERGRPAGTGTTSNKELPSAVYQAAKKKSTCEDSSHFSYSTKGAIT